MLANLPLNGHWEFWELSEGGKLFAIGHLCRMGLGIREAKFSVYALPGSALDKLQAIGN